MKEARQRPAPSPFRRIIPFLIPYRFWVIVKLVSIIAIAANDTFLVYLLNILINSSLSGDNEKLIVAIQYMLVYIAVGIIMNFLEIYASGRYSAGVARDLQNKFSAHIDKLPISYMEANHSGDLVSRVTNGIAAIENFIKNDLMGIVFQVIRLSASIIVMLFLNWKLLIFILIFLPLMLILTNYISRPLNDYSSKLQLSIAKSNTAVQETINGIHMIKTYNLVQTLFNKFKVILDQMLIESLKVEKRKAAIGSVTVVAQTLPYLLFFLLGGYMVIKGQFTTGGLVAFAHLLTYLVPGIAVLPNYFSSYKITAGVAEHLFNIFDEKKERTDGGRPLILPNSPALQFEGVSFSYDGNKKALDDIHFTLQQGRIVAFVGPSGSGKTTIFKLITEFYNHESGSIKLFNEPLAKWEISYARSQMALVSQETFLFTGTIAENITCGRNELSMEDVERAAKMANIHDYIMSLPDKYNSLVGERGVNLSGGQKQRISIARAIIKDAPILLLDEATSALDTESEMLVQEAIMRIMKDKTVIIIAHRLSTIIEADEVIVLNDGRIVESGTHAELLFQDGAYKRLYNNQLIHQGKSPSAIAGEGA